jgi:hypothetical protein
LPGKIYLPPQVLQSIREHVEAAVRHAESGYASAQEEEDTITGELGGALRTSEVRLVNVTDWQPAGMWRWSITYSKFGSKGKDATEFLVGADGIFEIRVHRAERDQRKAALFQAKNARDRDPRLVEQCAKMSVWREACFVVSYGRSGYSAFSIDDILSAKGSISVAENGAPLASWIMDTFIGCRIGHPDLHYDKDLRRLYWLRAPGDEFRWVWVDFSPKHLVQIDVTPPGWEMSNATEINPGQISLNRLAYSPEDLFGVEGSVTLSWLRRRRKELLYAYHSDRSNQLPGESKSRLEKRVIEIYDAFRELSEAIVAKKEQQSQDKPGAAESAAGLKEPPKTMDEFFEGTKPAEKVRVARSKKKPSR